MKEIASRALRRHARKIFKESLDACSARRVVPALLSLRGRELRGPDFRFSLPAGRRILILAAGKASAGMARALIKTLPPSSRFEGLVVHPPGAVRSPKSLRALAGSHPIPSRRSLRAGIEMIRAVESLPPEELVIHLISGGASALAAVPLDPLLGMQEKRLLHRLLIESGLGIREVNVVRRHFSGIKGGRLLARAPQANHLTILFSDVPAGCPEAIGGGPTLPDPSTWGEALGIMKDSGVLAALPAPLRARLRKRTWPETFKPGSPVFHKHRYGVLADSATLVAAASRVAQRLGYETRIIDLPEDTCADDLLDRFLESLHAWRSSDARPRCLLAGGEVRRDSRGWRGRGGRAQDLAAAAALRLRGRRGTVFLAAGSDGKDGNSPAAGALADGSTVLRGGLLGLDLPASRSRGDTYPYFDSLGDSLTTGLTGNNLRDLYLLLDVGGRRLSPVS